MQKTSILLTFALGAALGGGVAWTMTSSSPAADAEPAVASAPSAEPAAAQIAALEAAVASERARADAAIQALAKLQAQRATETADAHDGKTDAPDPQQARFNRMAERLARNADRRAQLLGLRLNLDEAQDSAMREILSAAADARFAMVQARLNGEEPPIPGPSVRDQLAEILTEDQLAEYDVIAEEQRRGRLETAASAQLTQLTSALSLDETQKDAVYSALYRDLERNVGGGDAAPVEGDPLREEMLQTLTPSQFAAWEAIRDQAGGRGGTIIMGGP